MGGHRLINNLNDFRFNLSRAVLMDLFYIVDGRHATYKCGNMKIIIDKVNTLTFTPITLFARSNSYFINTFKYQYFSIQIIFQYLILILLLYSRSWRSRNKSAKNHQIAYLLYSHAKFHASYKHL